MKEFVEKLIGRLEEKKGKYFDGLVCEGTMIKINDVISIVNQLAEEYKDKVIIDGQYCWQTCSATEHCKECNRLCNGNIDYYENYDVLVWEDNKVVPWTPLPEPYQKGE